MVLCHVRRLQPEDDGDGEIPRRSSLTRSTSATRRRWWQVPGAGSSLSRSTSATGRRWRWRIEVRHTVAPGCSTTLVPKEDAEDRSPQRASGRRVEAELLRSHKKSAGTAERQAGCSPSQHTEQSQKPRRCKCVGRSYRSRRGDRGRGCRHVVTRVAVAPQDASKQARLTCTVTVPHKEPTTCRHNGDGGGPSLQSLGDQTGSPSLTAIQPPGHSSPRQNSTFSSG